MKYVKFQRSYGFLITKELIFGFQILDLKDHFSASLIPGIPCTVSKLEIWVPPQNGRGGAQTLENLMTGYAWYDWLKFSSIVYYSIWNIDLFRVSHKIAIIRRTQNLLFWINLLVMQGVGTYLFIVFLFLLKVRYTCIVWTHEKKDSRFELFYYYKMLRFSRFIMLWIPSEEILGQYDLLEHV